MLASLLRLAALRPLLGATLLGLPIIVVLATGVATLWLLKAVVFVLPFALAWWLLRRVLRGRSGPTVHTA
ncbi:MAG: hypothetical protein MUF40_00140 [Gemmatimonadaceae bacterium]|nr:hypothetical protein [Gemmatimonadaceae bacterium]